MEDSNLQGITCYRFTVGPLSRSRNVPHYEKLFGTADGNRTRKFRLERPVTLTCLSTAAQVIRIQPPAVETAGADLHVHAVHHALHLLHSSKAGAVGENRTREFYVGNVVQCHFATTAHKFGVRGEF